MMQSTPFANIAITGAAIIFALLLAGVVLIISSHEAPGELLVGTAVGVITGTSATTVVVQRSNGFPTPGDTPK